MSKNTKKVDPTLAPIQVRECKLVQHAFATHSIIVARKSTIVELEVPSLYSNVAARMALRDRLEIQSADGTMLAQGIVVGKIGTEVKIKIYTMHDLGEIKSQELNFQGYIIRLNPVSGTHSVVNEATGEMVKDDLPTQESAVTFLTDLFKSSK